MTKLRIRLLEINRENRLLIFENTILRQILGTTKEEDLLEDKIQNREIKDILRSPFIMVDEKHRRMIMPLEGNKTNL